MCQTAPPGVQNAHFRDSSHRKWSEFDLKKRICPFQSSAVSVVRQQGALCVNSVGDQRFLQLGHPNFGIEPDGCCVEQCGLSAPDDRGERRQEDGPVAAGLLPGPGVPHLPGLPGRGLGRASPDEVQRTRGPQGGAHGLQLRHGRPVCIHVLRVPGHLLALRLQPPLSACGLQHASSANEDGQSVLVVLLLQGHRAQRHAVLHPEEEKQSSDLPARLPSRHHDLQLVGGGQVCSRRTIVLHRPGEHFCPHHHVLLLRLGGHRPPHAEVPVVEAIPDLPATAAVPALPPAHRLQPVHPLRLPRLHERRGLRLLRDPHHPLQQLLLSELRQREEEGVRPKLTDSKRTTCSVFCVR